MLVTIRCFACDTSAAGLFADVAITGAVKAGRLDSVVFEYYFEFREIVGVMHWHSAPF